MIFKKFYKIEGGFDFGVGDIIPDGYIEYVDGEEPEELVNALLLQTVDRDNNIKLLEYKSYLTNTDWYYARHLETGEEVPEDVVTKRTEAREYIRSIEDGK